MKKNNEFLVRDLTIDDEYDIINAEASVKDAALKMKEAAIPDLVVVDNDEIVLGVIADFDIVTNLVAEGISAENAKVTEIMYTIDPVSQDTPVSTAFTRMRDLDVSVIPVIEKNKLLGVTTITDCWGFLPEEYEDSKGLIPVANPRFFNYAFSLLMILLYLFFGVFGPLVGISGFLNGSTSQQTGGSVVYYLFEARGGGYYFRYWDFQDLRILIPIYGIIFLILGLLSAFVIYQWVYADYHLIKVKRNWQSIGLIIGVVNILVVWIIFLLFDMGHALQISSIQVDINLSGLLLSCFAIICLFAAVYRDILFRESSLPASEED